MKRIISLPTAIIIFFLIFGTPSLLSADSQKTEQDVSCIAELYSHLGPLPKRLFQSMAWKQQVSILFVGEVVWAQPREEAEFIACGIAVGSRYVRYRVIENLMGDVELGPEIKLRPDWCEFYEERYSLGAKLIVVLVPHSYSNLSDLGPWGWKNSKVAWELPLNAENRGKATTFIQCIQDLGLVEKMLKEEG